MLFGFQSLLQDLKKIDRMEAFCPGINHKLNKVAPAIVDDSKRPRGGSSDILETFSGISGGELPSSKPSAGCVDPSARWPGAAALGYDDAAHA